MDNEDISNIVKYQKLFTKKYFVTGLTRICICTVNVLEHIDLKCG